MALHEQVFLSDKGFANAFSSSRFRGNGGMKPSCPPLEGLQRSMSDLTLELNGEGINEASQLPPISEVEQAKCECCGMTEECTKAYIQHIRAKFSGRWICGLCTEAVNEEMKKVGANEEALDKHMKACSTFSRIARTQPVRYQAEAMRDMFRKCSTRLRDQKLSPAAAAMLVKNKRGIVRTSSCVAAITKEANGFFPRT
ncbi:hypothetical protein KSP39_PZI023417 [Platanthera zijinensis]|uniref:Uncharacterized protein n=1 Tax=Platanthera zijinensis TaxID=2320716 RepID=A0AAP0FS65_9ASPA